MQRSKGQRSLLIILSSDNTWNKKNDLKASQSNKKAKRSTSLIFTLLKCFKINFLPFSYGCQEIGGTRKKLTCTKLQTTYKRCTKSWSMVLSKFLVNMSNNLSKQLQRIIKRIQWVESLVYHWRKTPIKQGLFSLHDWYSKMKPFTKYGKKEYGIPTVYSCLSF